MTVTALRLVPIGKAAVLAGFGGELSAPAAEATLSFCAGSGFNEPCNSYMGVSGSDAMGVCSFKSAPLNGRVEIAYFVFPAFAGRGCAKAMAAQLVAIAHGHAPDVTVAARTLIEPDASQRVLQKLGVRNCGKLVDPDDGPVLEWRLERAATG
ncbi:MAG: GNAT family N-acetyltransferase [Gammaproteobacteria bacterium]|nr:GNAT family N-acetyltransferase [Gammaproteobacteria bacterium]